MFDFFTSKSPAKPLTTQESGYITSLKKLALAYSWRASLTVVSGDVYVLNAEGIEVPRTAQKVKLANDLIEYIEQNGAENLLEAYFTLGRKHFRNFTFDNFLGGSTEQHLKNPELFSLLQQFQISEPTLVSHNNTTHNITSLGSSSK